MVLAIVESPAAGTYTYKMQYSVDDTLYTLQVSSRSLQADGLQAIRSHAD